jgi:hypothetical protein
MPSSTALCRAPQEALGFVAAPKGANRDTIIERHTIRHPFVIEINRFKLNIQENIGFDITSQKPSYYKASLQHMEGTKDESNIVAT